MPRQEAAAANEQLSGQAEMLNQMVCRFLLRTGDAVLPDSPEIPNILTEAQIDMDCIKPEFGKY